MSFVLEEAEKVSLTLLSTVQLKILCASDVDAQKVPITQLHLMRSLLLIIHFF